MFTRKFCLFVPRKLKKVILIVTFIVIGIFGLLLMHVSAALIGLKFHELSMKDDDIIAAIPIQKTPLIHTHLMSTDKYEEKIIHNIRRHSFSNRTHRNHIIFPKCKRHNFKIVLFVRLPKCASTSFVNILKRLSHEGQFIFKFNPSGAYDWDFSTTTKVARQIATENKYKKNYYVYARHFYFVDFTEYNIQNFTYITIVREPVSRFISSYLYYHLSSKPHIQAILNPSHKNESLKTCLEQIHEGCQLNLMTKYFCGHQPFCKTGSLEALDQAKENIVNHFSVVGIMEDLTLSYKVFRHVIPGHFKLLDPIADSQNQENRNEHESEIPQSLREDIESRNKADVLLYYYIKERLYMLAKACSIG